MITRLLISTVLLWLLGGRATAATDTAAGLQPERWLLVVDVSAPMKNRAPAVREAVAGLLTSGMQGQLQNGHELGLWTFNDRLHTELDAFTWDQTRTNEIVRSMLDFLAQQKFSRPTQFGETLTNLQSLVRDSRRLTVIFFSDGDEGIRGTPFDEAIAAFFQNNGAEARSARVPLITVLRGSHGEWVGCEQSYPPWPVVFPKFPPEPEPGVADTGAKTNDATVPARASNAPPSPKTKVVMAEPLIVRGPDPLSKEIEERGLATNTAAGNLVLQKPPQPAPAEEPQTNEVTATDAVVTAAPAPPTPTAESPATESEPRSPRLWLFMGLGLLALAMIALLVLRQRHSANRRTSLITRSMNGD